MGLLDDLLSSWVIDLRARNLSRETIKAYTAAVQHFTAWCEINDRSIDPVMQRPVDVRQWIIDQIDLGQVNSAATRYRQLQQWFKWLAAESEIKASPMVGVSAPKASEVPPPVLSDDQLLALMATCKGNDWRDRRDQAMIRLFLDTGMRLKELVTMKVSELDLETHTAVITGKGNRQRIVPFGVKSTQAIDRYLRSRARRPQSSSDAVWLSNRGPISKETVSKILARRGRQAGVDGMHAHLFRHTAAHNWLALGGQELDLMSIAGWRSRDMIARYGASAAAERARQAHKRLAPGDRL